MNFIITDNHTLFSKSRFLSLLQFYQSVWQKVCWNTLCQMPMVNLILSPVMEIADKIVKLQVHLVVQILDML